MIILIAKTTSQMERMKLYNTLFFFVVISLENLKIFAKMSKGKMIIEGACVCICVHQLQISCVFRFLQCGATFAAARQLIKTITNYTKFSREVSSKQLHIVKRMMLPGSTSSSKRPDIVKFRSSKLVRKVDKITVSK